MNAKPTNSDFVGQALLDALESGQQLPRESGKSRWKGGWSPSKTQQFEAQQAERQYQPRHQQARKPHEHASNRRTETLQNGVPITKVASRLSSPPSPQSLYDKWNGVPLTQPYHPSTVKNAYPPNLVNHQTANQSIGTADKSYSQPLQATAPNFTPVNQLNITQNSSPPYQLGSTSQGFTPINGSSFAQVNASGLAPNNAPGFTPINVSGFTPINQVDLTQHWQLPHSAPAWLQPLQNIVNQHQSQAHGTKAQPIEIDSSEYEPPPAAPLDPRPSAGHLNQLPFRTRQANMALTFGSPVEGSAERPIDIDAIKNLQQNFSAINMQPGAPNAQKYKSGSRSETPTLRVPAPTPSYIKRASVPIQPLTAGQQRLLVILDLNGTLLVRTNHKSSFKPRENLDAFLRNLFQQHSVMIWSSSMPHNVHAILAQILDQRLSKQLVAVWARDTLRLSPVQLRQKLQVYKQLKWVWNDDSIAAKHSEFARQRRRWDQTNTVLIDDSILKAAAEPWNLVEIPEFGKGQQEKDVLGQILGYLDWLSRHTNVSAAMKTNPFVVDSGWGWNWG